MQHLLGIGHQMRAAAITRACLKFGFEVHYVSGGFPENLPDIGGAKYHQLPPVKTLNGDFNKLIDENGHLIDQKWWQNRSSILLNLYKDISPDIILLEGFPFARRKFKEELLPLLDLAKQNIIPCATSVRDILVDPKKDKKRQFALDITNQRLDQVFIHGEKEFCPLERSFKGAEAIGDKLYYTGYVDGGKDIIESDNAESELVISAGGGAVAEALFLNVIKAKDLCKNARGKWRLMLGPNLSMQAIEKLRLAANDQKDILLEPARKDFRNLLQHCKLSVSQAGYNTIMDILVTGVESLVVPYSVDGESEQSMRAELLEDQGRLQILPEHNLTPEILAAKINQMLERQQSNMNKHASFDLNGAIRTAEQLMHLHKIYSHKAKKE